MIFRHWLKLLYVFEGFLIAGGTIFVRPEIQRFGLFTLLATLIPHLFTLWLGDYMRGRRG